MAVNTMTFNQLATVLNSIVSQATGKQVITPTNTSEFVSVAKQGLETGYDPLNTAVSQVLSKTIFSIRPYSRKFKGLEADALRYGNHLRKINYIDKPFEEDDRIKLIDGQSVDPWKVNKPQVIQTNFYGENVYQKSYTVYRDQLDCAFSSPEEFARFLSGVMQNASDMLEQAREDTNRATLANLIGGTACIGNANQIVHLITEYNAFTGESITAADAFSPENFQPFARFVYGRISTLSKLLRERTVIYHQQYNAGDIARHTPESEQRLFLLAQNMDQIGANVLSTTFHDDYLKTIPAEEVMFWQSVNAPGSININAGFTDADGAVTSQNFIADGTIFGVLMDKEAAAVTLVNQWQAPSPFNPRGGYSTIWMHETSRYWNDFSENCIILTLD